MTISFIPRIHTFIATSPIHMEHKLKKSKEQVIEIARNMVKFARSLGCNDVEFSPEDAGRSVSQPVFCISLCAFAVRMCLKINESVSKVL